MARTGVGVATGRRSPSPKDDDVNTLIKFLTIVGVAIGIQQLVSPYVTMVMATVIAVSVTALFVLVSLVGIRIIRRWRDQVRLRIWVIMVCIATMIVGGVVIGFVLAQLLNEGATSWAGHL